MTLTVNEGTQTALKSTTDTSEEIVHNREDGGTLAQVTSVSNVASGTLAAVTSVTNLAFGTVDTFYRHPDEFATVVSTGTNTLGTIKAAVSGSAIYVTDLTISAGTATNVEIASGGTSTPILGTLHFADNGGAVINFKTPIRTASGSALVYKQSTGGPLTITAQGYVD